MDSYFLRFRLRGLVQLQQYSDAVQSYTTGLDLLQRSPATGEFLHDGFYRRGPDEWLRILVPRREERVDGGIQIFHASEYAPAESPFDPSGRTNARPSSANWNSWGQSGARSAG